jgi:hypothetical protein
LLGGTVVPIERTPELEREIQHYRRYAQLRYWLLVKRRKPKKRWRLRHSA